MAASSALLLSLVVVLASSSAWLLPGVACSNTGRLKHIQLYMHEINAGPNATAMMAASSAAREGTTFGMVKLLDNELRDGPDPCDSSLLGRFQGTVTYLGLLTPPGKQTAISFMFTAGKYAGSSLSMLGPIPTTDVSGHAVVTPASAYERPIVGGTGKFRMSRGYCLVSSASNPTPGSSVFEVNLFLKMDA